MLRRFYLILFLVILPLAVCFAQNFLVIEKMGTKKRIEIYPGEDLQYELKKTGSYIFEDRIMDLQDSLIILLLDTVHVKEISTIHYKKEKSALASSFMILPVAGVALLLIDQLNHVVIAGNDFDLNPGVVVASSTLVAAGVLYKLLEKKKYKLKGNWRVRVVDF